MDLYTRCQRCDLEYPQPATYALCKECKDGLLSLINEFNLELPQLVGSEKQIQWASTLREKFVAEALYDPTLSVAEIQSLLKVIPAYRWIDHRNNLKSLARILREIEEEDE